MLLLAAIIFAFVWTRLKKTKVGSLDEFMELKWLFPSRRRTVDYAEIKPKLAARGVCGNRGKKSPWTNQLCECTGYEFKKWKRGVQYCSCGCQMLGHMFTKRKKKT